MKKVKSLGIVSQLLLVLMMSLSMLSMTGCSAESIVGGEEEADTTMLTTSQIEDLVYLYQGQKMIKDYCIVKLEQLPGDYALNSLRVAKEDAMANLETLFANSLVDISYIDKQTVGVFALPAVGDMYELHLTMAGDSPFEIYGVAQSITENDIYYIDQMEPTMPENVLPVLDSIRMVDVGHVDIMKATMVDYLLEN